MAVDIQNAPGYEPSPTLNAETKSLPKPLRPESKWKTTSPVPLTRESFLDLLYGRTPLIKEPTFITTEQCSSLLEVLLPTFTPYLHATGPAVEKVGVAQFEFQAQSAEDFKNRTGDEKKRYFEEVEKLKTLHDDLAKTTGENVWKKVIDSIADLVPEWDVSVASEGDNKFFSGIFRQINNGVPIHCDWCPYDCLTEDWILSKITHQAVFNLYISPVKGGGTTLYDVQWSPEALKYRDPSSYGYFPALVDSRDKAPFTPEVGDLVIFNSRNMHEVAPIEPGWEVPRIALASFMGLLPAEVTGGRPRLMFWS